MKEKNHCELIHFLLFQKNQALILVPQILELVTELLVALRLVDSKKRKVK